MNARFRQHLLVRWFGSLKLMLALILIFAFACAVATIIESRQGTPAARALVYNALWFEAVMGLLIVNLVVQLFVRMPYRGAQTGFVLVHISMIVILVSAGITRYFGYEGIMPIREGQATDYILSSEDHLTLSSGAESDHTTVQLFRAGPQDLKRNLDLGDRRYRVTVAEYFPHLSEEVAEVAQGVPALRFATVGEGGMVRHTVLAGESIRSGPVRVTLFAESLPQAASDAALGELHVHHGATSDKLPVSRDKEHSLTLGEYCVNIEEFHPDYSRRDEVPPVEAMNNPMIRVHIEDGAGRSAERLLFAYFPDFSMAHGGEEDPFPDLHLEYRFERRLDLAPGSGDALTARANFPLDVVDMAGGEVERSLAVGESFDLESMVLHRSGEFSIVATEFLSSAARQAVSSDNEGLPPGARLNVTGPDGDNSEIILVRGASPQRLNLGGEELQLAFGPRRIPVPYRLHLEDFLLKTYPGSNNPASYESHVLLYDEEQGIDGQPVRIYMNHPLTYKGFKHFQSSYDPDRKGTVLSVNHDPGKWPTYFGYILISLGFILVLAKGWLWPERRAAKEAS